MLGIELLMDACVELQVKGLFRWTPIGRGRKAERSREARIVVSLSVIGLFEDPKMIR